VRGMRELETVMASITAFAEGASMNISFDYRHLSRQFFTQVVPGALALVLVAMVGAWLITLPFTASAPKIASNPHEAPSLGPGPFHSSMSVSSAKELSTELSLEPAPPAPVAAITEPKNSTPAPPQGVSHPAESAPQPPPRPAELGLPAAPPAPFSRPAPAYSARGDTTGPSARYDHWTAVYDLANHTVYLPNGARLEAHSGLGDRLDDPQHVNEINRGATPPHLYELTLREAPFHGVQALRLNPVGGGIFGRVGLLAHPYMLGPNGDSNGCVSFKDYDAFLQAYQDGQVKRLVVVARLD
jgi:hypothetical protein